MSAINPPATWTPCVPTKVKKADRKALREGPAPIAIMRANSMTSMNRKAAPSMNVATAKIKQLGSTRSAGGVAPQDRKGREQRREHHHVAEDEDPESISDDGSLGRR